MILGITGHRPPGLGCDYGYNFEDIQYKKILNAITRKLKELKPTQIISGMALGADTYAVQAALQLDIGYIAAIPFEGQENKWPMKAQDYYCHLLREADDVVIVSSGGYSPDKMNIRNRWIVNNSNGLLAIWNGSTGSGTYNCIDYARTNYHEDKYPIEVINPNEL
jgi:uncharacterized phage-like protein YoqJ